MFEDALVAFERHSGDTFCWPAAAEAVIEALQQAGATGLDRDRLDTVAAEAGMSRGQSSAFVLELRVRGLIRPGA